jgi:hypothetical protein
LHAAIMKVQAGLKERSGATERVGLVPLDTVARRLGLRASAIRYYDERGLLQPVSRHMLALHARTGPRDCLREYVGHRRHLRTLLT